MLGENGSQLAVLVVVMVMVMANWRLAIEIEIEIASEMRIGEKDTVAGGIKGWWPCKNGSLANRKGKLRFEI